MSDIAAKNEGEPLHIVSPSTIPLTLGEEMAVLVLPEEFYQTPLAARHPACDLQKSVRMHRSP